MIVRPYGDTRDDGLMQLSFTLPIAYSVKSADVGKATEIAHQLDTGTVWINQNLQSTPFTPLAGAKQSGFGQENGLPGLLEFTRPKSIYIPKVAAAA